MPNHSLRLSRWLWFLSFVSLVTASTARAGSSPHSCAGAISVPYDLVLESPATMLAAGASATVQGTIHARATLTSVSIAIKTEGSSQLLSSAGLVLPGMDPGEERTFSIPISLKDATPSAIHVQAIARGVNGESWERNESFFVIFWNGKAYAGMGSYLQLQMQAIEDDYRSGVLTEQDAKTKTKALLTLPGTFDSTPRASLPVPSEQQEASNFIQHATVQPGQMVRVKPQSPTGCITVQGNVSWLDENGSSHPAFGMDVQIWDDDLVIDEFITSVVTGVNGDYSVSVDNNDGIGQGDRDIYVKFVTQNGAVLVRPQGIFATPYEADSPIHDETPCGATITENFTAANTGTGPAVNLLEAGSWVASYAAVRLNGGSFLSQLPIEWPGDTGSANYNGSRINLRPGDRWDWDVEFHEYGHYIQDVFDIENNPGGPHNIGDCISDVHSSKDEGVRMGLGEGWPTYDGTVAQQYFNLASLGVPRVGDVSYTDTGESNFTYSLEAQDNLGLGEDNEIAVQRIFWDLYDSNADGRDNVQASDLTLFQILDADNSTTLSGAWAAIRGTLGNADQLAYGAVTSDHQVGPTLNSPAANAIVSPSTNNNFSWDRNVGCSTTYDGDGFTLRFFNASTSAPILSIPLGNTTSHALTLAEFGTLVGATHNVKWAVEGSNSDSPATGPYLGESFAAVINRPPVADAGPDQPSVECTSATTTAVLLDGTGSSDPDGDALTYTWSATGVTFDDIHSATPTGQFPHGTTEVTLSVSDGVQTDTDQVSITVVDTTPPTISCPDTATVECVDHCGTPKNDPQLTAFFAGASATDLCDTSPTLTNNAPTCLAHGATTVTFTAEDDATNKSTCTAVVNVVDTTPPVITVDLNRDVLWPANHKMSTITATVTVTDICDPNPTFVLTSITSNEPDNGLGDGDQPDDIQNAATGQSDISFDLRSERSGLGDGRLYTIIYTASDFAGNTAADTSYVRVPHDQSGIAKASLGFTATGSGLQAGAKSLTLVLTGSADFTVKTVDPQQVYVGNHIDGIRPMSFLMRDLDGDKQLDLAVTYDASKVRDLQTASSTATETFPVGLHYTSGTADYLVSDIFALGAPSLMPGLASATYDDAPGTKNDPAQPAETVNNQNAMTTPAGQDVPPGIKDPNEFTMSASGRVNIEVFDLQGRKVRTLLDGALSAGTHAFDWDGRTDAGSRVPSGIYFYRIQAPGVSDVRKVRILH